TSAMNAIDKLYTKRDDIKELVLLKTLADAYYNEEFDRKNILKIIDSIAMSSAFEENKKVAKNYFKTLTQLEIDFPAPNFKFQTQQGNVISLNDLKGKHIYLSFMSAQSNTCVAEMNALKVLYEKYGNVVEFVTIFIDKDQSRLNHFIKDKNYKWHIAHFNNSQELLNSYKIKTVPTYYLINENGKLVQLPALKPVPEGSTPSIDETFYKIKKGKAGEKEFNVGRK
ncbi:MAG: TlpA family protein disulfide reductase, partial [Bacteroidia bacterium]